MCKYEYIYMYKVKRLTDELSEMFWAIFKLSLLLLLSRKSVLLVKIE